MLNNPMRGYVVADFSIFAKTGKSRLDETYCVFMS
jgi:hypothetical protein